MTWWMRPGPRRFCASLNASPRLAERVRERDPDARVAHLAMRIPGPPAMAHHGASGLATSRPGVSAGTRIIVPRSYVVGIRIGDREHDPERRPVCAAREPLAPVDHPVVAVEHRPGAEQRRIGARHVGLGHREERSRPARDERLEEALLLLRRAELVQDLGVARIGRLAAEDELRPVRAPDLLVHAGVVEEPFARPACLRRHVRRPEPRLPRLAPATPR